MTLDEELEQQFRAKVKIHVGERYAIDFDPKMVVLKQKVDEVINSSKNAVLFGFTGTGKTMAMIYLMWRSFYQYEMKRALMVKTKDDGWIPRYTIGWYHWMKLSRLMLAQYDAGIFSYKAKNLFIDDFAFTVSAWKIPAVDYWFEQVYAKKVNVYMTTNLTLDEFKESDDYRRVLSRIGQNCVFLDFGRKDKRLTKS